MLYTEMKTFVRTHADTDEVDAPDTTLDVYARSAYNDIRRRVHQWIDNSTSTTFTTTADTSSYALGAMVGDTVEYVTGVVGPTEKLTYITWDQYLEFEDGPDIDYSNYEAVFYTVRNDVLYLFPKPSSTGVTYTVYGYRAFNDWPNGSVAPDLPREFDEAICWYMLSRFYMAQEDFEAAQMYMRDYEVSVNRFIAAAMRQDAHSPRILGGSRRKPMSYDSWVRRMTEG